MSGAKSHGRRQSLGRVSLVQVFQKLLGAMGREYLVAPDLPASYLMTVTIGRATELARGIVRTRRRVFFGRGVRIRGGAGIHWGEFASVGDMVKLDGYAREGVHLGAGSALGRGCVVTCTSHASRYGTGFRLGLRSGLGDYCHVGASGGVVIGDDVIAGPFVSFHSQEHVFNDLRRPIREQGTTEEGIQIANNCWLGARVTVLDGTRIGSGSVVAAGAVVKGNFPERSLIGGVPARILRSLAQP
jgi:acetyltransferase-like isoleucine patch superfamily enzyme